MTTPRKKSKKPAEPTMMTRGLRMSSDYSEWLERLARKERMSIASLIDRATAAYAEHVGFEAPPERVP